MTLRELPIEKLKPAPYNPRRTSRLGKARYQRLRRSMEAFDLVQPLVWNQRTGHLVAGHQRLRIARDQGRITLPCVVVDLPLAQEKLLNIALNNPAIASEWDDHRLETLLVELREMLEVDATLTGFDSQELRDLSLIPAQPEQAPAPVRNPRSEKERG